jgi:hypothetical protein
MATTPVTTMRMATLSTKKKPDGFFFSRLILWLAFVPAFVCLYVAVTYGMVRYGQTLPVVTSDNAWLESAASMAPFSPHAMSALAIYNRNRAALPEFDSAFYYEQALIYWDRASALRPGWPYYRLGAFDAVVLSNAEASMVQSRFDEIVNLAPNEQAMDEMLLSRAFIAWERLLPLQQQWVIKRLNQTPERALRTALTVADSVGLKALVCAKGPWVRVQSFCREGRRLKKVEAIELINF